MKYAIFIDGVRGGTMEFNDSKSGEFLKKQMQTKLPNVSIKPLTQTAPKPRVAPNDSIGGMVVRRMIEAYEKNNK
jgi:hypothetical protein